MPAGTYRYIQTTLSVHASDTCGTIILRLETLKWNTDDSKTWTTCTGIQVHACLSSKNPKEFTAKELCLLSLVSMEKSQGCIHEMKFNHTFNRKSCVASSWASLLTLDWTVSYMSAPSLRPLVILALFFPLGALPVTVQSFVSLPSPVSISLP